MRRRDLLAALPVLPLLPQALACSRTPHPAEAPIGRALSWLATQQAPDGSFGSRTYGLMKVGHSLTPFVGLALHRVAVTFPDSLGPAALSLRDPARDWCLGHLAKGGLGLVPPAIDYPVYATSLALRLVLASAPGRPDLDAAIAWLLGQQYMEGWVGHPTAGGFGMGRSDDMPAPDAANPGHVDLSMTRRAAQAVADCKRKGRGDYLRLPLSLKAVEQFARRCKAADGGFVYSPVELALNKSATLTGDRATAVTDHKGYGSATADAVLALHAAGVAATDPDLAGGLSWLQAHHVLDRNPGLEDAPIAAYGTAMRGYYRAASAEVFAALEGPPGWRDALVAAVLAEQGDDGSWRNPDNLQKEDDPLISTASALQALVSAASVG